MTIHVTPIPSTVELAAPAFTLGTANTAGAASTAVSSNSTLLVYDASAPVAAALTATGAAGSQAVSARRDHVHGAALVDGTAPTSWGIADTAAGGAATVAAKRDHLHGNLLAFTLARLYGH